MHKCEGHECPYQRAARGQVTTYGLALIEKCYSLYKALDRAVEDIRMLGRTGAFICPVCAYYNHGEGTGGECVKCLTGDGFRWRGDNMDGGAE